MAITKVQPFNLNTAATYTFGNIGVTGVITAVGNITAPYIIGNGSQITGVTASNVGTLTTLSVTGNVAGGNILTGGIVSATGNVTGNYFVGNGSQLTGIDATSIQNGTSNVKVVSSGGNVSVSIGGTPDIAVFSSTGEYVTGEISASGNVTGSNILTGGLISAAGNVTAGNVSGTNVTGTLTTAAQPNVTSVGTLTSLNSGAISSSGNVTGANFLTGGLISAAGNIDAGNVAGTYLSGTLTTAAQPNVTSVGTLTSLNSGAISSSGNVTGANFLTGGLISATGNVDAGNVEATNWVKGANVSTGGNVLVGGYISVVGNLYVANIVSSSNLVVQDPLVYLTANATYPYNYDIGFFSQFVGNPGNTYQHTGLIRDYTDDTWKLFSNVVAEPTGGSVDLTGAIYDSLKMGALTATTGAFSSTVSATGNITGGNVLTGGLVSATGNITGNYFFGNGSQLTGIDATSIQNGNSNVRVLSSGGNVSVGIGGTSNVAVFASTGEYVTGEVSATGNITGNYFLGNGSQLTGIISGAAITNDVSTNATYYVTLANVITGSLTTAFVANTKLTFNPSTGELGATNFNSLSDQSKKTDVETIAEAVELVMHLRGVYFRWKDTGKMSMGLIAQEVEQYIPEVVTTAEDGTKSISYGSIVGLLVEVVKNHEQRIKALEAKLQ